MDGAAHRDYEHEGNVACDGGRGKGVEEENELFPEISRIRSINKSAEVYLCNLTNL